MSKIGFSKTDNRRAVMALAVVAMFLATMGVSNVEATSVVSIEANETVFNIMEDGKVEVILSISSADSRYNAMDLFLKVIWPDGEDEWETDFTDTNYLARNNVSRYCYNTPKSFALYQTYHIVKKKDYIQPYKSLAAHLHPQTHKPDSHYNHSQNNNSPPLREQDSIQLHWACKY